MSRSTTDHRAAAAAGNRPGVESSTRRRDVRVELYLRSMDPILIGFLTTGATLFVTVALFAIDYVRRWRGDSRRHREAIVKDVLATVERASRNALRAPLSDLWSPSQVEYALLLTRLLATVPKEDEAVGYWAARQVQLQRAAPNRKEATQIGFGIATEVVKWSRGERSRDWFIQENERDPWVKDFKPSRQIKLRRQLSDGWDWARFGAVFTAVALAVRAAVRAVD